MTEKVAITTNQNIQMNRNYLRVGCIEIFPLSFENYIIADLLIIGKSCKVAKTHYALLGVKINS